MNITIWHNPRCSKSRQTLKLLQDRGIEPEIVDYQKTPPTVEEISRILVLLEKSPREIIRKGEKIHAELNLTAADDDALIAAMAAHPVLIERPIVEVNGKAALGRPPENVLAIL